MGANPSAQLRQQVDELELMSMELKRGALRSKKAAAKETAEIKKMMDAARTGEPADAELINMIATNVIRFNLEHKRLLRVSSRMRGFAIRMRTMADTVDAVEKVRKVTKVTSRLIKGDKLDLSNIVSVMEEFDRVMGEMDDVGETVTTQLDAVDRTTVDADAVGKLLSQIEEDEAMRLRASIPIAPTGNADAANEALADETADAEQVRLMKRFQNVFA